MATEFLTLAKAIFKGIDLPASMLDEAAQALKSGDDLSQWSQKYLDDAGKLTDEGKQLDSVTRKILQRGEFKDALRTGDMAQELRSSFSDALKTQDSIDLDDLFDASNIKSSRLDDETLDAFRARFQQTLNYRDNLIDQAIEKGRFASREEALANFQNSVRPFRKAADNTIDNAADVTPKPRPVVDDGKFTADENVLIQPYRNVVQKASLFHYSNWGIPGTDLKLRNTVTKFLPGVKDLGNMSRHIPRFFTGRDFIAPVIKSVDSSIKEAGLISPAKQLQRDLEDIASGVRTNSISIDQAKAAIVKKFDEFGEANADSLANLEKNTNIRLNELNSYDGVIRSKYADKLDENGNPYVQHQGKEGLMQSQMNAMTKYVSDINSMSSTMRNKGMDNEILKEFIENLDKAGSDRTQFSNMLSMAAEDRMRRMGRMPELRLAGKAGDAANGVSPPSLVDELELQRSLDISMYQRATRFDPKVTEHNAELLMGEIADAFSAKIAKKGADFEWTVDDANEIATKAKFLYEAGNQHEAARAIKLAYMQIGRNAQQVLPGGVAKNLDDMSKNAPAHFREFVEDIKITLNDKGHSPYLFSERDMNNRWHGVQRYLTLGWSHAGADNRNALDKLLYPHQMGVPANNMTQDYFANMLRKPIAYLSGGELKKLPNPSGKVNDPDITKFSWENVNGNFITKPLKAGGIGLGRVGRDFILKPTVFAATGGVFQSAHMRWGTIAAGLGASAYVLGGKAFEAGTEKLGLGENGEGIKLPYADWDTMYKVPTTIPRTLVFDPLFGNDNAVDAKPAPTDQKDDTVQTQDPKGMDVKAIKEASVKNVAEAEKLIKGTQDAYAPAGSLAAQQNWVYKTMGYNADASLLDNLQSAKDSLNNDLNGKIRLATQDGDTEKLAKLNKLKTQINGDGTAQNPGLFATYATIIAQDKVTLDAKLDDQLEIMRQKGTFIAQETGKNALNEAFTSQNAAYSEIQTLAKVSDQRALEIEALAATVNQAIATNTPIADGQEPEVTPLATILNPPASKDDPKDTSKDDPKDTSKDDPKDTSKDDPKTATNPFLERAQPEIDAILKSVDSLNTDPAVLAKYWGEDQRDLNKVIAHRDGLLEEANTENGFAARKLRERAEGMSVGIGELEHNVAELKKISDARKDLLEAHKDELEQYKTDALKLKTELAASGLSEEDAAKKIDELKDLREKLTNRIDEIFKPANERAAALHSRNKVIFTNDNGNPQEPNAESEFTLALDEWNNTLQGMQGGKNGLLTGLFGSNQPGDVSQAGSFLGGIGKGLKDAFNYVAPGGELSKSMGQTKSGQLWYQGLLLGGSVIAGMMATSAINMLPGVNLPRWLTIPAMIGVAFLGLKAGSNQGEEWDAESTSSTARLSTNPTQSGSNSTSNLPKVVTGGGANDNSATPASAVVTLKNAATGETVGHVISAKNDNGGRSLSITASTDQNGNLKISRDVAQYSDEAKEEIFAKATACGSGRNTPNSIGNGNVIALPTHNGNGQDAVEVQAFCSADPVDNTLAVGMGGR